LKNSPKLVVLGSGLAADGERRKVVRMSAAQVTGLYECPDESRTEVTEDPFEETGQENRCPISRFDGHAGVSTRTSGEAKKIANKKKEKAAKGVHHQREAPTERNTSLLKEGNSPRRGADRLKAQKESAVSHDFKTF